MKQTDRFLLAIIAGIVVLVVVALSLALTRSAQGYLPDTTPGGVAHNFVFAIKQHDDRRAYSYLSPDLDGYPPDLDAFTADINAHYSWQFNRESATISVDSERISDDRAVVSVVETRFYENGLFSSGQYRTSIDMTLRLQGDSWRLISAESYWAACWNERRPCE